MTYKLAYLSSEKIHQFIAQSLQEDVGDGDHSSLAAVPAEAENRAKLIIKDQGILAGIELATLIFAQVDSSLMVDILLQDSSPVKFGDIGLTVSGKARSILQAERLVLNCMQRMSGIATYTHQLTEAIKGTKARLLDTRKTTPLFRMLEKWAVVIGGGLNHRFGLFDMIILKDNHVDYAGGIRQAIESTNAYLSQHNKDLKIVIETRNLAEVEQVLETGNVFRIMLDNMSPALMKEAIQLINGRYPTEASGGITLETIKAVAESGVDFISVGALTHSIRSLDISLKAY
ncbi:carboxylating nicotinate-nucleotide diphosphorylase [Rhodocytophaga rosea]|uniref:Probable nicotinate-nucleotide pyrophosphorylase [carboxylating] n=1 Tax=Rhodocytophaga rosea TaxID=2704465 RepID=A0A6C0GCA6_9BACT|nr:carboxylating nicotinate-nucleotide diphosphorylase [Rhodocytophaga rosea]QHT65591.1 carboxylating nicotinate-nucleotide diphosphorylase [Rhodocytophaga rosea]